MKICMNSLKSCKDFLTIVIKWHLRHAKFGRSQLESQCCRILKSVNVYNESEQKKVWTIKLFFIPISLL